MKKLKDADALDEFPQPKYHNNPDYHWEGNKATKPSIFLTFDPATFKDYPEPPTQQAIDQYTEWRNSKKANHRTIRPQTISINPAHYSHPYGTLVQHRYYMSPEAKANLYTMARKHWYGRSHKYLDGNRQANISKFVRALTDPQITWADTRPSEFKEGDTPGYPPLWLLPSDIITPRRPVWFYLTVDTEQALYNLALRHGVINWNRPQNLAKGPVVGFLLEVIGQGRLTPDNIPMNPHPATSYPRRHFKYRI